MAGPASDDVGAPDSAAAEATLAAWASASAPVTAASASARAASSCARNEVFTG